MGSEMEARGQQQQEWACGDHAEDQFDRLPDAVLLDVFNRIGDVKALGRCALVSRRFHDLVPLVDSVFVRVDCVIADDLPQPSADSPARGRGALAHIARLLLGGITRPIRALGQILSPAAAASPAVRRRSPPLRPRPLWTSPTTRPPRSSAPTGELGIDDGMLLKWNADFGSTLGSCVILGASSVSSKPLSTETAPETASDSSAAPPDSNRESEESGDLPEPLYTRMEASGFDSFGRSARLLLRRQGITFCSLLSPIATRCIACTSRTLTGRGCSP
jgi:hypothetical protein